MSMSSMMESIWFYVAVLGVLCFVTVLPLVAIRMMATHEKRSGEPAHDRQPG